MKVRTLTYLVVGVALALVFLNIIISLSSSHLARDSANLKSLSTIDHALIKSAVGDKYSNNICLQRYNYKDYSLSDQQKARLSSSKYLIIANLHNNERMLDYFLSEMIYTIKMLLDLTKDPESIYMSIYESDSSDLTPNALQSFATTLDAMNIPNSIISNPRHKRKSNQPRIEFLADVRNRAMKPFQPKFDQVLIFNDVYFCKNDILRLLLYNVDMACSMDFDDGFRDTWVMRTIDGNMLSKWPQNNYDIAHAETLKRFKEGKAFHVLSAYNGLAIVKGAVFQKIKFRDGRDTSCPTSECALLCLDMWKLNFTKIIVDPRVLVAYNIPDFERLNSFYSSLPPTSIDYDIPYFPMPDTWQCCPIYGANFDSFREDCRLQSLAEWKPK